MKVEEQEKKEVNVGDGKYVLGETYNSNAGHVVYVGFSEDRQRHLFDLAYNPKADNPFYAGESMPDRPCGNLGEISKVIW